MNMGKYLFEMAMVLMLFIMFAAPAMAGPNTGYLVQSSSSANQGEIVYVEIWVNITDPYGQYEDYTFQTTQINVTFDPSIGDIIATNRMDGDPWNAQWDKHRYGDTWFFVCRCDEWVELPYGLGPGTYPVANLTIQGVNPGTMDLHFSTDQPRACGMYDAIGEDYPNQTYIDGTFTCIGTVIPETFTKSLPEGWNLISLPLTSTDNSVSVVLNGVSQDAVKSYNTATHQFKDATTMDPGIGYFVHVTTAGTWEYEGTAYTSMTASLSQGLNCVGWTNTSADLPGALSSIDGSYRYVAHWDTTSQSYEVYEPNAPAVFNDFATIERGEGYFIAATADCTLTSP